MTEPAAFQNEIYFAGLSGTLPALPLRSDELAAAAAARFEPGALGYVAGAAGIEDTQDDNVRAFTRWRIVPRMGRDVSERRLGTSLFGRDLDTPVLLAPVGVQSIVHDQAELATARAASSLGVPYVLSTVSSFPLEEVAAAGDGPRWFQLYWPSDRAVAASLVQRAERAGFEALVVTMDTKILAWRPRDLATAYLPFLHAQGLANYFTDPAFTEPLESSPQDDPDMAVLRWIGMFADKTVTWSDFAWLREQTSLPILAKGVCHPADAQLAVDHGVDGVIVSNHGGRQVDGALAALDALPGVVATVGDQVPVLFDSGIRSGADIVKALALGANAVLLGRPWVFGLGLDGEAGVRHVVRSLLAEFDLTMALSGMVSLDDLSPEMLVPARNGA